MSVTITTREGQTIRGATSAEVMRALKLRDWTQPASLLAFKGNVANRTEVLGVDLRFWDATSFLMALAGAGFITVQFDNHPDGSEDVIHEQG